MTDRRQNDAGRDGTRVDRRLLVKAAAAGSALFGLSLGLPRQVWSAQTPAAVPADAAPPEQQVWRVATDPAFAKVLDFYEQVYERPAISGLSSDPLVRLSKNFEIIPGAATAWSGSEDGKTWTFTIDPALMWDDGNPVTANDWIATFQYAADPEHAWDFAWFWSDDIVNFTEAVAGTVPPDQIGVRQGANDRELVFETVNAAPYLPAKLLYSGPLSAAALASTGPLYNNDPATAVSAGPFTIEEWVRDQYLTYRRNEAYTGKQSIPMQRIIVKFAPPAQNFTLYEAGEVDYMEYPAPAELTLIEADPELAQQVYQGVGDFRVDYLFFDVTKAPFDNLMVRQAFSHVIDRDAIKQQILGNTGNPAYGFLAPGFPAANQEALAGIQNFDPAAGQKLLADAGYPNGESFPQLELWLRAPTPIESAVGGAIGAMLKQHLNIDVQISARDQQLYMDALTAKPTELLFGFVSYGMDYLDPSNMLGLWTSGGRHSWSNPEFDRIIQEANVFLGDPAERIAMYQEAERVLVTDVPAVFIHYRTPIQLIKPFVKGDALAPDTNGIAALHWPGFSTGSTVPEGLYIGNDAPADRS
ncbi:MAG: peptide ABC transporter substrate-binding protein [Chloroflexia bacterium]|nr:peptide ABC transporter substrate-binding protein [Chloroflexia bacterium]